MVGFAHFRSALRLRSFRGNGSEPSNRYLLGLREHPVLPVRRPASARRLSPWRRGYRVSSPELKTASPSSMGGDSGNGIEYHTS